ncbi:alpha/beta fold hydrolase [Tomitella fengzijianii]|nr:alpha/beta fold hydrolase [Tomitella fengzijianii]
MRQRRHPRAPRHGPQCGIDRMVVTASNIGRVHTARPLSTQVNETPIIYIMSFWNRRAASEGSPPLSRAPSRASHPPAPRLAERDPSTTPLVSAKGPSDGNGTWANDRMSIMRAAGALAAALVIGLAASPAESSADSVGLNYGSDGVDYSPWAGVRHAIERPGSPVPGTDEQCRPTEDKPRPVMLLHGTGMNGLNTWSTLAPALAAEGYCVFAPTYGAYPEAPGVGGVRKVVGDAADEVAAYVDEVRARTGAEQVDLVGHSLGAPVGAYVAKALRPGDIGTVVFIAGYWMRPGTSTVSNWPALRPLEKSGRLKDVIAAGPIRSGIDLVRPSPLIDAVWAGGTPYLEGVRYRTIASEFDEVFPPAIGFAGVDGGEDVIVQDGCDLSRSGHMTMPSDPRVVDLVLGALDPRSTRAPRCVPTDPMTGAQGMTPR